MARDDRSIDAIPYHPIDASHYGPAREITFAVVRKKVENR